MDERQTTTNKDSTRHAGMFPPGVSGNPSGRPKSDATIRELARVHTETALLTLVEVIQNKKAPPSARVHAASAILDRGWGKPSQYIETLNVGMTFQEALDQMADRIDARKKIAVQISDADVIPEHRPAGTIKQPVTENSLESLW